MTLSGAGAAAVAGNLAPDWHLRLSREQLLAYIRFQFVRLYENVHDWDEPVHNRKRVHWDGGVDNYGVNKKAAWGRIADMIRQYDADPGMWVLAHFSPIAVLKAGMQTNGMPEMRPTRLSSGQSFDIYKTYRDALPDILSNDFEVAGMTLAKRIRGTQDLKLSTDDQVFYCVCDELYVSGTPFFRHAFAAQLNCFRGVERYLWRAALDYEAQQRVYDAVIEPWCVTELLTKTVQSIRDHWESYR